MKKTLLFFLLSVLAASAFSQTADEVINKFIEASGGKSKLTSISTLQYNQSITLKSPMGDLVVPIQYFKENNKFYRMQANMQFAGQSMKFFTLLNDSAGYLMVPAMPMLGTEGGLKKLNEVDRKHQIYQMDAAGYFPDLIDYTAKGNKLEKLKDDKVNKEDCYQLKQTLSNGQTLTYFINKTTNLVARVDATGEMAASMSGMGGMVSMMGGRLDKMEASAFYMDYKDYDGLKFPAKVILKTQMGDSESLITNVKINEIIDPKYYMPQ